MSTKKCGKHAEIVKTGDVRITQCPCGSYHLHLQNRGVSVQLGEEEMRKLAEALDVTVRVADAEVRGRELASRPPN